MKQITFLLIFAIGAMLSVQAKSDKKILEKSCQKLQNLKVLKYQTSFANFDPMGITKGRSDSGTVFNDFNTPNQMFGAKFCFQESQMIVGFDGTTTFFTDKQRLAYLPVKSKEEIVSMNGFPIHLLRELLPQMLQDDSIYFIQKPDTLINKQLCYNYLIEMHGKVIFMNQEIREVANVTRHYRLSIDKADYLPRHFAVYNDENPIWLVDYGNYDLSFEPADSIFNCLIGYSQFEKYHLDDFFKLQIDEEKRKREMSMGIQMKDWTLPTLNGDSVTLSKIDAELTLLTFWFPGCGGCLKSIPHLNNIQKKYNRKDLKIYGIEFTKADSTGLHKYTQVAKMEFPTLYAGQQVATNNSVSIGPTIYILNKKGTVLYSNGGFNKEEVLNTLEKYLNKP